MYFTSLIMVTISYVALWCPLDEVCESLRGLREEGGVDAPSMPLHLRLTGTVGRAAFFCPTEGNQNKITPPPSFLIFYASFSFWCYGLYLVLKRLLSPWLDGSAHTAPLRTGYENQIYRYRDVTVLGPHMESMVIFNQHCDFCRTASVGLVTGPLTVKLFREALKRVMAQHGMLRCGFHRDWRGRYVLHEYFEAFDLVEMSVLPRESDETWQEEYTRVINRPRTFVAHDRLLWAVTFVQGPAKTHEVIFTSSHAIVDGTSNPAFLSALLTACAEVLSGTPVVQRPVNTRVIADIVKGLPQYPSWRYTMLPTFVRAIPHIVLSIVQYKLSDPTNKGHPIPVRREKMYFRKMSKKTTAGVLAAAKANGITVHSVIHGVYCVTFQEVNTLKEGFRMHFFVPTRPGNFLTPPQPHTEIVFSAIGVHMQNVVKKNATWLTYAKECQHSLHTDPKTKIPGSALYEVVDSDAVSYPLHNKMLNNAVLMDNSLMGRISHGIISNLGDVSKHFPKDYLAVTAGAAAKFVLEEFYVNQTNRVMGPEGFLILQTFHGEMFLCFNFPTPIVKEEKGRAFVEKFVRALEVIGGK